MKAATLITVSELCVYHNVDPNFMNSLRKAGLVEVTVKDDIQFVRVAELKKLEKVISLHRLDINIAGIEAIIHLLNRFEQMQENIRGLHNKLKMYEEE
ncbi:chaperone modulator CbpM [Mucilaginibacter sp. FT3.2]|uniref:chaperone modulator CbpM n=1 Tax=Mucilaginibacter sp. FT3.2 TaxID=2723090 RepID=UPI001609339E|nr:chaperone modulator CbpM [Mucilaginibacter sp. FT3.2]MBB6234349.1 hypothetical protein [Mucilaginibacter sp. FT3.2]